MGGVLKLNCERTSYAFGIMAIFLFIGIMAITDANAATISLLQGINQTAPDSSSPPITLLNFQRSSALDISTGMTPSGDPTFTSRYSFHNSRDLDARENKWRGTTTSQYTLLFVVEALGGEQWKLNIDTRRQGASTKVFDGDSGNGEISSSSVTGTLLGTNLDSGTIGLPEIPSVNSFGSVGFNQTSTAMSEVNSGSSIISLQFSFDTFLSSLGTSETCHPFGGCTSGLAGPEVAFRLGLPNLLSNTTAGDYPGLDNRDITQDGHFVTVSVESFGITPVPLPSSVLLFGTGLFGLVGWRWRQGQTK